ncbi:MAG TPA: bifunctional oligoribonuclease/PAP phosphatase NrnA [Chthoniobacterales bacterium]
MATLPEIGAALRAPEHRKYLVVSHMRPDGDALGSEIAMALILKDLGKDVTTWNEDGMLEKLNWLPGAELVSRPPNPENPHDFDVVVVLDTASKERVGTPLRSIGSAKVWINIDHHVSNAGYGDLTFVDAKAPATGEILFKLFRQMQVTVSEAVAENLFVAISTDTGSFQYPSTTAGTYEIGAELIRLGANVGRISQDLYESYPLRRVQLLKSLLNELRLTSGNRVASFALTAAEAAALGVQPEDNEGLIDHIRAIQGVQVAVFFEELPEGRIRVSARSKNPRYDVCKICQGFGGGGHALAAGARVRGTLDEVRTAVLKKIDNEFEDNNDA